MPMLLALALLQLGGPPPPQSPSELLATPLVVNGEAIEQVEVERVLSLVHGGAELEAESLWALTRLGRELHRTPPGSEVGAHHAPEVAHRVELERQKYASWCSADECDWGRYLQAKYGSPEGHAGLVRARLAFDDTWLPSDVEGWLDLTTTSIRSISPEYDLIADYSEHTKRQIEEWQGRPDDKAPFAPRADEVMLSLLRDTLRTTLRGREEPPCIELDQPDPGVLFRARGVDSTFDVTTDQVVAQVLPRLAVEEIRAARRYVATLHAVRQRLTAEQKLLSPAAAREHLMQGATSDPWMHPPHRPPLLPVDQTEAFHTYGQRFGLSADLDVLLGSFAALPQRPSTESLKRARHLRTARVDAEALLLSAYDFEAGAWIPQGWSLASAEAQATWLKLTDSSDPDGAWSRALEQQSDFYDPPRGRGPSPFSRQNGRLQKNTGYAYLRQVLKESAYSRLAGYPSNAQHLVLTANVGEFGRPVRTPHGYVITRLFDRRVPPAAPQDAAADPLLALSACWIGFGAFADESVARAEIVGL